MRNAIKFWTTAALLAASGAPAVAGTVTFTGTRSNTNTLNPPGTGRCAPLNTVNIAPGALLSSGSSNLGAFASTQSHCIAGPPGPMNPVREVTDGEFTYAFEQGDSFFGTYTGVVTFASGVVTGVENLIVTGGTGRFLNATGSIVSTGTLTFGMVNGATVGIFNGTVNGVLDAPAIPEPATWGLMIAGFAGVGLASRRRARVAYA